MTDFTPTLPDHAAEVMYLFGFPDGTDQPHDIWWRTDYSPMKLFVDCSDVFAWGTSDVEVITEEDMPLLRECATLLHELGDEATTWLAELYTARKRSSRPMPQFIRLLTEPVEALFPDAPVTD